MYITQCRIFESDIIIWTKVLIPFRVWILPLHKSQLQYNDHVTCLFFVLKGWKKWPKENVNAYLSSMWWYRAQSNNTLDDKTVDLHYCSLMSQLQTTTNEWNTFLQLKALYNSMWRTFTTRTVSHKWQPLYYLVIKIATRGLFLERPAKFSGTKSH